MSDLENLSGLTGDDLTETQIKAILRQIDLDITNLLRDGKLAALKYAIPGAAGRTVDRAASLGALLKARTHYRNLLEQLPAWEVSRRDSS